MRRWKHFTHKSSKPLNTALKIAPAAILIQSAAAFADETYRSSAGHDFRLVEVATGLESPWSLAFLPGGEMLVTERDSGRLRLIRNGKLQAKAISGTPSVGSRGQGGLLDVAVHPDFANNGLIYLSYSSSEWISRGTEVMRARLEDGSLTDEEVIFRVEPKTSGSAHYGSRLLFAPDGTLFVTLGERYSYLKEAQNLANHLGTVVRINDDGSIPEDNPFVSDEKARAEIYSYGHRNSQGIALRPGTDEIWQHEHGPRGGDEVNILKAGANYGWPAITYGIDYSGATISDKTEMPGMEQPVVYWDPSIAPSGMAFYDGDKFPNWKGDLFVGALAGAHLRRLRLDGQEVVEQEPLLESLGERIRDVRSGPDGFLYIVTDHPSNGRVLRLEPVSD